jgi:hypothetical protein
MFAVFLVVACAEDVPVDYSQQTRDDFLTACTVPLEDTLLQVKTCQCIFDKAQLTVPYSWFSRYEEDLIGDPLALVPGKLAQVVADCIVEEADL